MTAWLAKVGLVAFRKRWYVLGAWFAAMVIAGGLAALFFQPPSSSISIPGTEAQTALDRYAELFPDAGKGSARIALESKDGTTIASHQSVITTLTDTITDVKGVSMVVSPLEYPAAIAKNGTIAYISVQLDESSTTMTEETRQGVMNAIDAARSTSLDVEANGDIIDRVPGEIVGIGEVAGVALALVVLIVTLGSLVAAGLPIVVAIVSVIIGVAGLFALSHVVDINSTTPVLGIMLGLAVGIDYSLFIVNKYRQYLLEGFSYEDAASRSIATAGNAVIFAAATVVIALSALAIVQVPFMTTMGLAGASTVALAAFVAVTLLPALLGFAGERIFRGKTKAAIRIAQKRGPKESHRVSHSTLWYRIATTISRRPVMLLIGSLLFIVALAWPVTSLRLGLPTDQYAAETTTQRKAYDILAKGFGEGVNAPLLIVVEDLPVVTEADRQAVRSQLERAFSDQIASQQQAAEKTFAERAAAVSSPEEAVALQRDVQSAEEQGAAQIVVARQALEQQIIQYSDRYYLAQIAERISKLDDVIAATPALVTSDTRNGVIQIIPLGGPSDQSTADLVETLRTSETISTVLDSSTGSLLVTGSTAVEIDINDKLAGALPQYLLVVIGLSLVLLLIVFRSIVVPLKATLGFLLSVAAMFGAVVAVFQWGWFGIADSVGPIISFVPIIAIGVLFGLAMDYEFFLVSSMHEEYERTGDTKRAVISGYSVSSRVVVAAGCIMVAIFAGFTSNHDVTVQTIGFGLAIGVLIDAFVVRLIMVPAVMTLLGKSAWWLPSWLQKTIPRVSIEGELPSVTKKRR